MSVSVKRKRDSTEEEEFFISDLDGLDVSEKDREAILAIKEASPHMSAYECKRALKLRQNNEVLKSLGLLQEKPWKPPPKAVSVPRKWTKKVLTNPEPERRSSRIAGAAPVKFPRDNWTVV
eukprot:sb/3476041/